MQLTIQAVNFSIKSKLKLFISKRIDKYEHYYGKILSTDLYMKLEKSAHSHGKQVEIKVKIPGDTLMVKKESNTFEEAIDAASKAVERLLIRYKEKQLRSYQNGV
jgi:putative sigma-54 modulation protein